MAATTNRVNVFKWYLLPLGVLVITITTTACSHGNSTAQETHRTWDRHWHSTPQGVGHFSLLFRLTLKNWFHLILWTVAIIPWRMERTVRTNSSRSHCPSRPTPQPSPCFFPNPPPPPPPTEMRQKMPNTKILQPQNAHHNQDWNSQPSLMTEVSLGNRHAHPYTTQLPTVPSQPLPCIMKIIFSAQRFTHTTTMSSTKQDWSD